MRYFLLNSLLALLLLLGSCGSVYKKLQTTNGDVKCMEQFRPQFTSALYSTQVDILKHHLSGLLFFKQMPDSSTRVVFANEMGFKFFDFEFSRDGKFTKHYLLDKMDKPAVVKTLEQDFALVLMNPDLQHAHTATDKEYNYIVVPTEKGNNYYITDTTCSSLVRIEKSSKRRPAVTVWMQQYSNGTPDTISIRHEHFKFNISLHKVVKQ
jgi:hypothetical protein